MKLYRFSPVKNEAELRDTMAYIHFACFSLCRDAFRKYLPVAGNMGVFCHYDDEYIFLTKLRKQLTQESGNVGQKYFPLNDPIVIPKRDGVPSATYTHLYIRKPDPYRSHVGDVDFILEEKKYQELKRDFEQGKKSKGARLFERPDLDMIELYNPDIDALGYVSPRAMVEKVRTRQPNAPKSSSY